MDQPTRGWKSDEDRGPIGAWFVRAIGERSIETVAKDMADRGHTHKVDYYRGIMSGTKKPGRVLLAALEDYLGSSPDQMSKQSDQGDMVAAMDRQTAAITAQTAMLERVLMALGVSPPDPLVAAAQADWSGAERRLADEKAGTTSLPRKPSRGRRTEGRRSTSREGDPA